MTSKTPIRAAAEALCLEYLGQTDIEMEHEAPIVEAIIKRALSERVRKSVVAPVTDFDSALTAAKAEGHNQCREDFGL